MASSLTARCRSFTSVERRITRPYEGLASSFAGVWRVTGEIMPFSSNAVVSGVFGNAAAIYVVMIVVGVLIVTGFVVGWLVLVSRGSNSERPNRSHRETNNHAEPDEK